MSEESINKLTDVYIGKLQAEMNIQVKIKSRNKKAPVVTVMANILNHENFETQATNDKNLQALVFATLGLKEQQGKTDADLLADPVFQRTAVNCIENFINDLKINEKGSLYVTCEQFEGKDGKIYWKPEEPGILIDFVRGK